MNMSDISLIQFNRLRLFSGVSATITRGDIRLSPTVVLSQADRQSVSSRDVVYDADTQDILIAAADYADLGEPQDADRIVYTENGQQMTADVRPFADNMPCFVRWDGNAVFRVHCKIRERQ